MTLALIADLERNLAAREAEGRERIGSTQVSVESGRVVVDGR